MCEDFFGWILGENSCKNAGKLREFQNGKVFSKKNEEKRVKKKRGKNNGKKKDYLEKNLSYIGQLYLDYWRIRVLFVFCGIENTNYVINPSSLIETKIVLFRITQKLKNSKNKKRS